MNTDIMIEGEQADIFLPPSYARFVYITEALEEITAAELFQFCTCTSLVQARLCLAPTIKDGTRRLCFFLKIVIRIKMWPWWCRFSFLVYQTCRLLFTNLN